MKSKIKILGAVLAVIISTVIFTKQVSAQQGNVSFQVFYDQLSPYGQWVDHPNYGYIWLPDAGQDFFPYSSNGHWILTDYGWTWVSNYNWGWAPFHYGRWDYDNNYGWFWVPDNEWGPAWVTWRRSNGYYGWAPMEPGISINISFGPEYRGHNDRWVFVRDRYIDRPDINRYYVNRNSRDRIIRNSQVINNSYVDNRRNTTYVSGPRREDVQQITGRRVNPVAIHENDRPGQDMSNGQLHIYRPQVVRNNEMGQKPAPSRVVNTNDVKRPSERNAANQPRNVNRPQNANQPDNNRQGQQSNTANPQRKNNNSQASKQQNANTSKNDRSKKQTNAVKPSDRNKNVQQKRSKSEQNRNKTD